MSILNLKFYIFIPELFFCLFTLSLIFFEYFLTNKKINYYTMLVCTVTALSIQLLFFILIYKYIYLNNDITSINTNNFCVTVENILLKIICSVTLLFLFVIKFFRMLNLNDQKINTNSEGDVNNEMNLKYYLIIFCFSYISLTLLTMTSNFVSFIVCLEFLGLCCVILVTEPELNRHVDTRSVNTSLAYYLIHVFGSILLLSSVVSLYMSCGTLSFSKLTFIINEKFINASGIDYLLNYSLISFLLSLFVKAGIAPFYIWVFRIYKNLNMFNLAYFLIIIKICIIFIVLKFVSAMPDLILYNNKILAFLALVNISIGSITTTSQTTFKKFIIGSSITNAGYFLLSICCFSNMITDLNFLLFSSIYLTSMLGLFIIESYCSYVIETGVKGGTVRDMTLQDCSKLPENLKLQFILILFCLMGFPPSINFFIKMKLLLALSSNNNMTTAVIIFIFSIVAFIYYIALVLDIMRTKQHKDKIISPTLSNKDSDLKFTSFIIYKYMLTFIITLLPLLSILAVLQLQTSIIFF